MCGCVCERERERERRESFVCVCVSDGIAVNQNPLIREEVKRQDTRSCCTWLTIPLERAG